MKSGGGQTEQRTKQTGKQLYVPIPLKQYIIEKRKKNTCE